jgi:glutathione S-transferase
VDAELAGKQYRMGGTFSAADAYLLTVGNWCARVGVDISALAQLAALRAPSPLRVSAANPDRWAQAPSSRCV